MRDIHALLGLINSYAAEGIMLPGLSLKCRKTFATSRLYMPAHN